ncbi:hypothetical protein AOLI_G00322070 [Acnodon oligacanthus]
MTRTPSEGTGQQQVMGDESSGDEQGHILNRETEQEDAGVPGCHGDDPRDEGFKEREFLQSDLGEEGP